ncbi:MAG: ImmA/IrrE family metallo-endopeptidase [Xanthobacteraceae bacterium]
MTFSHELGHLVMHPSEVANLRSEGALQRVREIPLFKSAEWQARKFASLFLMPTDIVRQFATARDLAEGCKVSLQAAEIRFGEVGHIAPKPLPDCIQDAVEKLKT